MNSKTYYLLKKAIIAICMIGIVATVFMGFKLSSNTVKASTYNIKYFKCITIEESDSLWTIAEDNISEEYDSMEAYISEVKSINNLTDDKIYCGASLVVPYYAEP